MEIIFLRLLCWFTDPAKPKHKVLIIKQGQRKQTAVGVQTGVLLLFATNTKKNNNIAIFA